MIKTIWSLVPKQERRFVREAVIASRGGRRREFFLAVHRDTSKSRIGEQIYEWVKTSREVVPSYAQTMGAVLQALSIIRSNGQKADLESISHGLKLRLRWYIPQLVITDTNNDQYTVTDIVAILIIPTDGVGKVAFEVQRYTFTESEFQHGFISPHVTRGTFSSTEFCWGHDAPMMYFEGISVGNILGLKYMFEKLLATEYKDASTGHRPYVSFHSISVKHPKVTSDEINTIAKTILSDFKVNVTLRAINGIPPRVKASVTLAQKQALQERFSSFVGDGENYYHVKHTPLTDQDLANLRGQHKTRIDGVELIYKVVRDHGIADVPLVPKLHPKVFQIVEEALSLLYTKKVYHELYQQQSIAAMELDCSSFYRESDSICPPTDPESGMVGSDVYQGVEEDPFPF